MKDFIMAALPWLCIGVAIALCAVNFHNSKKAKQEERQYDNYISEGMCLGMCVGLMLGVEYLSYGLLVGMVIGMCIRKPGNSDADENKRK